MFCGLKLWQNLYRADCYDNETVGDSETDMRCEYDTFNYLLGNQQTLLRRSTYPHQPHVDAFFVLTAIHLTLIFRVFQMSTIWPTTALSRDGFQVSMVDEIQFMLISSCQICIRSIYLKITVHWLKFEEATEIANLVS